MNAFLRIWLTAIYRPQWAFSALSEKPAPNWGLYATLVRFVGTAVTSILALYLLDRRPFVPSYLTFLDDGSYYGAEILFLPLFGVGVWLLSSALVHLIIRYTKVEGNIDWVMNVIGFSLLVVIPVVWLVDWVAIALDIYGASITIPLSRRGLCLGSGPHGDRIQATAGNGLVAFGGPRLHCEGGSLYSTCGRLCQVIRLYE